MAKPWSARGKGLHFIGPVLLGAVLLLIVNAGGGSKGGLSLGGVAWQFSVTMVKSAPGLAILGGAMWLWNRGRMVMPNDLGMVPLNQRDAKAAAITLVTKAQAIQEKTVTNDTGLPTGLTHYSVQESRVPPPPPPAVNSGPVRVPPFAKMLEVDEDKPEIYVPGVSSSGALVTINYEKAGPFTVTGVQGTFKTEVLVQAVMHALWRNMRVALFDPDAGHPQSLTNRLGPLADERILRYPMGYDEASCRRVMQMLFTEAYEAADKNLPMLPLFAAMDEANATATLTSKETKEAFVNLTALMSLKLRKRIVTMGMALQNPTEKKAGNDGNLKSFGWAMSGRVEPMIRGRALRQANAAVPEDIGMLPLDGTFYVFNPMVGEIVKMHIALSTPADLHAVYERCVAREQVSGVQVLNGHTPEELVTTQPLALVEDVDWRPGDPDKIPVARYRELHSQGLSNRAVLEECWGEGVGGRKYTRELKNLREATASCTCGSDLHKEKVSV